MLVTWLYSKRLWDWVWIPSLQHHTHLLISPQEGYWSWSVFSPAHSFQVETTNMLTALCSVHCLTLTVPQAANMRTKSSNVAVPVESICLLFPIIVCFSFFLSIQFNCAKKKTLSVPKGTQILPSAEYLQRLVVDGDAVGRKWYPVAVSLPVNLKRPLTEDCPIMV